VSAVANRGFHHMSFSSRGNFAWTATFASAHHHKRRSITRRLWPHHLIQANFSSSSPAWLPFLRRRMTNVEVIERLAHSATVIHQRGEGVSQKCLEA
jgi:hypothetical protein